MPTRTLIVDDSRSALDFLTGYVEADGNVDITTLLDPLEAIALVKERDFDLVLVDYEMPRMDGITFISELRMIPRFFDTPIVMVTSNETEDVRMRALHAGANDFLPKRPQALEMRVRLRNLIKLGRAVRKLNERAADLVEEVAAATRARQDREEEIIMRLALAVEYRDNETGEHTLRVAKYSQIIADAIGLPARFCRDIYLAAPLHDVGKVGIPDRVLLKPGRLNSEEMEIIRTHTTIGGRILADSRCELIQLGAAIAGAHHERWDGSGYPLGLEKEQIPLAARIVAVADVFDALTTKRPYKEAMPLQEARAHIQNSRGRDFDPACVDAFLSRWDQVVEICTARKAALLQAMPAFPQEENIGQNPRMAAVAG